jgi:sulfur carrier protein ThiS
MDISIEFIGFPILYDIFPEGPSPYAYDGNTVAQLLDQLIAKGDTLVRESLLDPGMGSIDPAIQVMINGKFLEKEKFRERRLDKGDSVTVMRLLAGG